MMPTARRSTPRHRVAPERTVRLTFSGILKAGFGLVIAVVLGLGGVGATYAYLNAATSSGGATISAGSAVITVSGASTTITNMYPGQTQSAPFTVSNVGTTGDTLKLSLGVDSISGTSAANGLVVTVADGACGATATGVSTGTIAGTPLSKTVTTRTLCLYVSMPSDAPATAMVTGTQTVTVTIGATQVL